jgi:hypothetical protein
MKVHKDKIVELERRLFFAYRAEQSLVPGTGWQESVMDDVRRLRIGEAGGGDRVVKLENFAWRFSIAACFVALLLLAYVLSTGIVDYQELAMRYLENPVDFII